MTGRAAVTLLLCSTTIACRASLPDVPDDIAHQVGAVEAPATEHLLLYPSADLDGLLGREIQLSESGGWTISDARSPGCEVVVHRSEDRYTRTYTAKLDRVAALSAGYRDQIGLGAHYGSALEAHTRIDNTQVLRADLRGACGRYVIDSVRVGTGTRSLVRSATTGGQAGGGSHGVAASGELGSSQSIAGEIAWTDPQVYAFTFREFTGADTLELTIDMPTRLRAGEQIRPTLRSSHEAWIVVFYLTEDGRGGLIYPSAEHPELHLEAGVPFELPALVATLSSSAAARETLVVYGFRERGDFDRFKPPAGGLGDDQGAEYVATLTEQLAAVPLARWARDTVSYVIEP